MVNTANIEQPKGFAKYFNIRTSQGKFNVNSFIF